MVAQQPFPDTLLNPLRTPLKILIPDKTGKFRTSPRQGTGRCFNIIVCHKCIGETTLRVIVTHGILSHSCRTKYRKVHPECRAWDTLSHSTRITLTVSFNSTGVTVRIIILVTIDTQQGRVVDNARRSRLGRGLTRNRGMG